MSVVLSEKQNSADVRHCNFWSPLEEESYTTVLRMLIQIVIRWRRIAAST